MDLSDPWSEAKAFTVTGPGLWSGAEAWRTQQQETHSNMHFLPHTAYHDDEIGLR